MIIVNETNQYPANSYLNFQINEMNNRRNDWWLFIHNVNERASSYDWNSVNLRHKHHYEFTYTEMSYELLPSPYATNCIDYRLRPGLKSRKDCIRKCKIRENLDKCGVISYDIDVYSGEQNVRFAKTEEELYCYSRLNIDDLCSRECSNTDCFKQYMEMKILEEQNDNGKYGNVSRINIRLPFEPKSTFIHRPSIETVEFLCYLASTLSLWFGFSVIAVYAWLINFVRFNSQANFNFISLINPQIKQPIQVQIFERR